MMQKIVFAVLVGVTIASGASAVISPSASSALYAGFATLSLLAISVGLWVRDDLKTTTSATQAAVQAQQIAESMASRLTAVEKVNEEIAGRLVTLEATTMRNY